ncbi:MAG: hypothetical protein QOE74_2080 [Mycobacterium sp.]|jgi:hypothetical protein|nr:hypothetical protein [Mycobacterium sp.]
MPSGVQWFWRLRFLVKRWHPIIATYITHNAYDTPDYDCS